MTAIDSVILKVASIYNFALGSYSATNNEAFNRIADNLSDAIMQLKLIDKEDNDNSNNQEAKENP